MKMASCLKYRMLSWVLSFGSAQCKRAPKKFPKYQCQYLLSQFITHHYRFVQIDEILPKWRKCLGCKINGWRIWDNITEQAAKIFGGKWNDYKSGMVYRVEWCPAKVPSFVEKKYRLVLDYWNNIYNFHSFRNAFATLSKSRPLFHPLNLTE